MRPETKALLIAGDASPVVSGSFGSCPWEAMMIVTMVVPTAMPVMLAEVRMTLSRAATIPNLDGS